MARRSGHGQARGMSLETAPGSVVVGVDGSAGSDVALDWAADQAALEHLPLTLLHGMDPVAFAGGGDYGGSSVDYPNLAQQVRSEDTAVIARATMRVRRRHGSLEVLAVTSEADPRSALLEVSREAAMVVVGSRGRGPVASLLLGSVSVAVSKHASCPVVVLRPGARAGHGVLLGVDGTEHSLPAVEFAYRMASLHSCPLTVLYCYHDTVHAPAPSRGPDALDLSAEEQLVAASIAGMAEKFPEVQVHISVVPGDAAPALLAAARGTELIVVGHHRLTPLRSLLHDPIAATVLEYATGPVAIVPSL